tara:strand:- start:173 stop:295 length:123 start_codon:yes stop_codon:yes gene_type:complete
MAEINLHPGDKVMSGLEVAKGRGKRNNRSRGGPKRAKPRN